MNGSDLAVTTLIHAYLTWLTRRDASLFFDEKEKVRLEKSRQTDRVGTVKSLKVSLILFSDQDRPIRIRANPIRNIMHGSFKIRASLDRTVFI